MRKEIKIVIDTEEENNKILNSMKTFLLEGLKSEEQIIEIKVEIKGVEKENEQEGSMS